ncbi:MAG: formylglycine-generating enzyme family protein [bacterium]
MFEKKMRAVGFLTLVFLLGCHGKAEEAVRNRFPGMIYIPAGYFIRGTDLEREPKANLPSGLSRPPYENESPRKKIYLDTFYIDKYEVTYREYQNFIYETGYPKPRNWDQTDLFEKAVYPVLNVSWQGAAAYAKWRGKRLPSESEWEKAARGTDGRRFIWGNDVDRLKGLTGKNRYYPVNRTPDYDVSSFGVRGMLGNVSEWTAGWYRPYPGNRYPDPEYGKKFKVIRGGTFDPSGHYNAPYFFRAAYRMMGDPKTGYQDVGFRCARSAKKKDRR